MLETTNTAADIELGEIDRFRVGGAGDRASTAATHPEQEPPSEAIRNFRVALITMPFASCRAASIQLGLLKSIARDAGFAVDDYYPNVEIAGVVGVDLNESLCFFTQPRPQMTGDWLFSMAAFGPEASQTDYFGYFPEEAARIADESGKDIAYLNDLRERVMPEFVDAWLNRVDWGSYNVIAFTSTFQQHIAALALSRRIKQRYPEVVILFGGANLDGEMGLEHLRAFPWIDYAVIGEGDVAFPALLTRLAEGRTPEDLIGVAAHSGAEVVFTGQSPLLRDMDSLPIPDFNSYYDAVRSAGLDQDAVFEKLPVDIPVEGSRGCWWGDKQHCTFCGLDNRTLSYRSKSSERLLAELDLLHARHGAKSFWATDNILDWRLITDLFGRLADERRDYRFHFNLKANLNRDQIRTLARGGVVSVTPGIESLSSRVLKLMRKGCTKLQHITMLKWSRYYGIDCGWNLLHGFPGERPEDYADQLATLKHLAHIRPPTRNSPVLHVRFSPLFFDDALFPKNWRRPLESYDCIYPEYVDREKVAYYFNCEMPDILPDDHEIFAETEDFVNRWLGLSAVFDPALTYRRTESDIQIADSRRGPTAHRSYTLLGLDADIYESLLDWPLTPAQVRATLAAECPGIEPDEEAVAAACEALCDAGLMIGEAGKYLSLAVPADPEPWQLRL